MVQKVQKILIENIWN